MRTDAALRHALWRVAGGRACWRAVRHGDRRERDGADRWHRHRLPLFAGDDGNAGGGDPARTVGMATAGRVATPATQRDADRRKLAPARGALCSAVSGSCPPQPAGIARVQLALTATPCFAARAMTACRSNRRNTPWISD